MRDKIMRPIILVLSIGLLLNGAIIPSISSAYAMYGSTTNAVGTIEVAKWSYKVNLNQQQQLNIDLKDTIIENNYSTTTVIPGTKGEIDIELDFSGTEVDALYELRFNSERTLPSNIKFYEDATMTKEIDLNSAITGKVLKNNNNEPVLVKLYWKWIFTDENENAWANASIVLGLVLEATQSLGGD